MSSAYKRSPTRNVANPTLVQDSKGLEMGEHRQLAEKRWDLRTVHAHESNYACMHHWLEWAWKSLPLLQGTSVTPLAHLPSEWERPANCSGGAEDFYRTEKLPVLWCFTVVSSLCAFTLVTVIININIVIVGETSWFQPGRQMGCRHCVMDNVIDQPIIITIIVTIQ